MLSDSFIKKAPCNGTVLSVSPDQIIVQCTGGAKQTIDTSPQHLKSGSGKDTLSVFNHTVKKGQKVKKGKIISEGSCVSGGTISMGRTLCVALMPYGGYNFEDGIVISDSLVANDKLTSIHGIVEEVAISAKDRVLYICNIGESLPKGQPLLKKTIGEIDELLGITDDEESIETMGGDLIKKSPGGKVVDIEVFSNVPDGT